ncbi:MAG: tetratricopeptide repeat protein [Deltaproteobacteria bacterium]|nr:tetratricopeptide repeat protein [Deltaproteobacteria bacterium]
MGEIDRLIHGILNHGPSADSVYTILQEMKSEGRSAEVVKECIRFRRVYPDHIGLRLLMSESCMEMGFIGLAESELEKAMEMIEAMVPCYRLLGEIYARQGRVKEASHALGLYLAHNPDDPGALRLLEGIGAGPVEEEAPLELEEKEGKAPSPAAEGSGEDLVEFASPTIAELYYEQGNLSAAVNAYEKVVEENPDDMDSIRRLAELRDLAGGGRGSGGDEDAARIRTEEMINILERWLPRIREIGHA